MLELLLAARRQVPLWSDRAKKAFEPTEAQ
jgi:hypothetical protein